MKRKKKIKPFRAKASYETRFSSPLRFEKQAEALLTICRSLSQASRKASLSDRIKMRKIINSLTNNAEKLEGGGK